MDTVTRRKFLKLTTGAVAVGAAAPLLSIDQIAQAAIDRPLPAGTPILVVVTLYGGNDGLNTVVPYTDPIYYSSRPEISYKADQVLPLDAELALNPAMKGLKSLWDQKKVAIVRGVGYPNPDHSHFSSMAKWQTASPAKHFSFLVVCTYDMCLGGTSLYPPNSSLFTFAPVSLNSLVTDTLLTAFIFLSEFLLSYSSIYSPSSTSGYFFLQSTI